MWKLQVGTAVGSSVPWWSDSPAGRRVLGTLMAGCAQGEARLSAQLISAGGVDSQPVLVDPGQLEALPVGQRRAGQQVQRVTERRLLWCRADQQLPVDGHRMVNRLLVQPLRMGVGAAATGRTVEIGRPSRVAIVRKPAPPVLATDRVPDHHGAPVASARPIVHRPQDPLGPLRKRQEDHRGRLPLCRKPSLPHPHGGRGRFVLRQQPSRPLPSRHCRRPVPPHPPDAHQRHSRSAGHPRGPARAINWKG